MLKVLETEARSILARTSGYIEQAGFTHSLNPARNCTYGCTFCYVPTMRIHAGLQREDWERWGQFTTFKTNAAELLRRELRPGQLIYCSSLVDPYQPAEAERLAMPPLLEALAERPPELFVIQTRSPLTVRDIPLLRRIRRVRVSFSLTTNRDEVLRRYEPHSPTWRERLAAMRELRAAGIEVYATLAPLLPGDPEAMVAEVAEVTPHPLIADPLHIRAVKRHGATTREAALRVAAHHGEEEWLSLEFQTALVERVRTAAAALGREVQLGIAGFAVLARAWG